MPDFKQELKQQSKRIAVSIWRRIPWQYKPIVLLAGIALVLYIVQAVVLFIVQVVDNLFG